MAGTLTLTGKTPSHRTMRWEFTFLPTGTYLSSGAIGSVGVAGEILNFQTAVNTGKLARPKLPDAPAGRLPATADFSVVQAPAGYSARVERNAVAPTAQNMILRIFTTAGTELTGAPTAYPAALLNDPVGFVIHVKAPMKYN